MTGSVHRSHRRTMLAPACLLLVHRADRVRPRQRKAGTGPGAPPHPARTSGHGQTAGPASGGGTPHLSGTYVALGDSFTAAPLAHSPGGSSPVGCLRSVQDYPSLVAAALHPTSFVNVSCFGASTAT